MDLVMNGNNGRVCVHPDDVDKVFNQIIDKTIIDFVY